MSTVTPVSRQRRPFRQSCTHPTNAVLRRDIGLGYIANDDGFTYTAPTNAGDNRLTLQVDGRFAELFRDGVRIVSGTLAENAPFTIIGAAGVADTLTLEIGVYGCARRARYFPGERRRPARRAGCLA